MRLRYSSFLPTAYQCVVERVVSLIPPQGILYEDLRDKAFRMYCSSPKFVKTYLPRILEDMEELGIVTHNSKLIKRVPGKLRKDLRKAYNLLKLQ